MEGSPAHPVNREDQSSGFNPGYQDIQFPIHVHGRVSYRSACLCSLSLLYCLCWHFETIKEPRSRFQGIDSAGLCSLAGQYDNPNHTQFLAPIDCSEIPPLGSTCIELVEFRSVENKLNEIDERKCTVMYVYGTKKKIGASEFGVLTVPFGQIFVGKIVPSGLL
jgi:hypothetical protein